jgi:hypothetical protein
MFNTRWGGELWLLAATFLKGQEMEELRRKSPLRDERSGLDEIQRTFGLVMATTTVGAATASTV